MRRLFWLAMGVTIGALIVRRLTKVAERLTPKGLAETLGNVVVDLISEAREFASDVRDAMSQREHDLREGSGLDSSMNGVGRR